ncbi:hypothetical protein JO972_16420 [Verrucomicrobiaceae bacterium 5K15]|uniref:Uncharacterized protein n=1 Tax=Oceaniferula flava TaxID=2800421 RepID=A0AAE2VE03_9BACT|nr:hypothetical protein [Oceaniferula flavus]MBK1856556.1 hypothetical protein [Oceaniferula flavus]MBM1137863.1 hypothetical protein [Oceaniferula flavus]
MNHEKRHKEIFDHGYRSIGRVVYYFQQLECELASAVSFLIDPTDGDGADIVVCELSFKQLAHIGYSLFDRYDIPDKEEHLKEWQRVLGLCLNAENRRNQLVHSNFYASYISGPDNMEFIRYKKTAKFKKGSRHVDEQIDDEAVNSYLDDIGGVVDLITTCMDNAFPDWTHRQWTQK